MSILVSPANVTRAVNLTAKTITLRWKNNNDSNEISYEFQFIKKASEGQVSDLKFTPLIITTGSSLKADLVFKTSADVTKLENYYAEVRAVIQGEPKTASAWAREEISWVTGASLSLNVAGKPLVLSSDDGINRDIYAGNLDFRQNPVSLVKLVNQFLAEIDLELPSGFPLDLVFYYISGFYKTSPKYLQINALASIDFKNPFGLANITIGFENLMMSISYGTSEKGSIKSLSISGDIVHTPQGGKADTAVKFGSAVIVLGNKVNVLGLEIVEDISPAGILEALLSIKIPPEVGFFLPTFRPLSPTQPIRLYKASEKHVYELVKPDGTIQPMPYEEGFNLDQLIIDVVGCQFFVSLNIPNDNKFTLTASTNPVPLFGLVTIQGNEDTGTKGPKLTVQAKDDTVLLQGRLLFFPEEGKPTIGEKIDFRFSFTKDTKEFRGKGTYIGKILEQTNPSIGFSWSETYGFNITEYPFDFTILTQALDWAKQLQELANQSVTDCASACGKIEGLLFNENITTTFAFKYKPAKNKRARYFGLDVTGTYTVSVFSVNIEVPLKITLEIRIPSGFSDLGNAIVDSLVANVENIAKALWDNKESLAKLMGMLTLKMTAEAAKKAVCRLACQAGEEALKKALQAALDAAIKAAEQLVAATIETAAEVITAAAGVISAILAFITWLVGLSDDQKRQKAEAERKQQEARDKIRKFLIIAQHSAVYSEDLPNKGINVSWSEVNKGEIPKKGLIYYTVSVTNKAGTQVYNQQFSQDKRGTRIAISQAPNLVCGEIYKVDVQAFYKVNDDKPYSGDVVSDTVITPILQQPVPVMTLNWLDGDKKQRGIIDVSWQVVSPVPAGLTKATLNGYIVELHNITKGSILATQRFSKSKDVLPVSCAFQLYHLTDTGLPPDPNDQYQVWIKANATDSDMDSIGKSDSQIAPTGIEYMQVGYNFKVN
jgi:hypothetical protein